MYLDGLALYFGLRGVKYVVLAGKFESEERIPCACRTQAFGVIESYIGRTVAEVRSAEKRTGWHDMFHAVCAVEGKARQAFSYLLFVCWMYVRRIAHIGTYRHSCGLD